MSDLDIEQSIVLAADYRVEDPEQMWSLLTERRSAMADIGAHHVVVYTGLWEPGRVLVTLGVRHSFSTKELIRSAGFLEWFDAVGVDDVPPVFAGRVVEKIDLDRGDSDRPLAPGLIVSTIASVADVPALMGQVHGALDRFRRAGVRKVWVYQAIDDPHEVLILHEFASEADARRWIEHPDRAAQWMSTAGLPTYPPLFVGTLAHLMRITD